MQIATRAELRGLGLTDRRLAAAVASGALLRVRKGIYASPDLDARAVRAVRVGGRLACVSALRLLGVYGFDDHLHVHLDHSSSRLRSPGGGALRRQRGLVLHWSPLIAAETASPYVVDVVDALAQAVRCQPPRHAVASLDSALHQGLLTEVGLSDLFATLPRRLVPLRARVDGRSESGQESVLRCALEDAGLSVEVQVTFRGIGRVDFVVEGCLVIEADSREAHDGWELHVRDRDRDIDLARRGYMSLRPAYNRIMYSTEEVVAAALALVQLVRR